MVMDNKESKGQGTLLQVTKRDSNARISSLKELIEVSPRPSNHLIATGPKLDGNTLHIRVVLRVNSHSLVKVAYMLYRVHSTIAHCECWLSKSSRKFSSFNSVCER